MNAAVSRMNAGSQRLVRFGAGAKWGALVSTIIRSIGTDLAASRTSLAFSNVTTPLNETKWPRSTTSCACAKPALQGDTSKKGNLRTLVRRISGSNRRVSPRTRSLLSLFSLPAPARQPAPDLMFSESQDLSRQPFFGPFSEEAHHDIRMLGRDSV
jgi:hypothetical protein